MSPCHKISRPSKQPRLPCGALATTLITTRNGAVVHLTPNACDAAAKRQFPLVVRTKIVILKRRGARKSKMVLAKNNKMPNRKAVSTAIILTSRKRLQKLAIRGPRNVNIIIQKNDPLIQTYQFDRYTRKNVRIAKTTVPLILGDHFRTGTKFNLTFASRTGNRIQRYDLRHYGVKVRL